MYRVLRVGVVFGICAVFTGDLIACGDKFLRIGRAAHAGRYVAVYPARVLLYQAQGAAAWLVKDLEKVVKAAGHTPVSVTSLADANAALASGTFDIVLAGPDELSNSLQLASSGRRSADLVPILYKPTKAELAAAHRRFECVIGVPADHKNRALAEIDCRMELRGKAGSKP